MLPPKYFIKSGIALSLSFISFGLFQGCGDQQTSEIAASTSSTQCDPGTAIVGVQDGALADLCGCRETNGQWQTSGTPLNCTVSKDTTVIFQYIGTKLQHQIVSANQDPLFPPSPPTQIGWDQTSPPHAVKFTQTGTYPFKDNYNQAVSGRIIVQ